MIEKIIKDIENARLHFQDLLIGFEQSMTDSIVSWPNYITGIPKNVLYAREYEFLKDNKQYTFLLRNKGFIQFYFEFKDKELLKAKLAYYPYPVLLKAEKISLEELIYSAEDTVVGEYYYDLWQLFQADLGKEIEFSDSEISEENLNKLGQSKQETLEKQLNEKYALTNSSHIRLDYDNDVTSHHKFEIQYSSLNTIRIPINKIFSPFLFMDFIARNEFADWFKDECGKVGYKAAYAVALKNSNSIKGFNHNNIYVSHD